MKTYNNKFLFKAVIFDIDGTAIPVGRWARPSNAVKVACIKAQAKGLILAPATGRNYLFGKYIIDELQIVAPSIVAAGTQIVDSKTGTELWARKLKLESCAFALEVLKPFGCIILVDEDTPEKALDVSKIKADEYRLLDVQDIPTNKVDSLVSRLLTDTSLSIAKVNSVKPGFTNLHITDKHATKKNAIAEWLSMMKITKNEVVGIGDGFNDAELFKSVGYKVAMGNAVPELKELADEVIDTVDNDGLAKYIESLL